MIRRIRRSTFCLAKRAEAIQVKAAIYSRLTVIGQDVCLRTTHAYLSSRPQTT